MFKKMSSDTVKTLKLALGPVVTILEVRGATPEQVYMHRAFALVAPEVWGAGDWRGPVSAVLLNEDLDAAGVSLADVCDAVQFFTATPASVTYSSTLKGEPAYIIRAVGYRRGPAH